MQTDTYTPIHPYTGMIHTYRYSHSVTHTHAHPCTHTHTHTHTHRHMHSALTLHSERAMTVVMTLSGRG